MQTRENFTSDLPSCTGAYGSWNLAAGFSAARSCAPSRMPPAPMADFLRNSRRLMFMIFFVSRFLRTRQLAFRFQPQLPARGVNVPAFFAAQRGGDILLFQRGQKTFSHLDRKSTRLNSSHLGI